MPPLRGSGSAGGAAVALTGVSISGAARKHSLNTTAQSHTRSTDMAMFIGEALVGEGNEIAHIDLLIGDKGGPVGQAFANALARQSKGHSNLLAVLAPNLAVKPATVLITKVSIQGAKQAV